MFPAFGDHLLSARSPAPTERRARGGPPGREALERNAPRICWHTIFICRKLQWYGKPLKQLGLLSRQADIRRVTGASSVNWRGIGAAPVAELPPTGDQVALFRPRLGRLERTCINELGVAGAPSSPCFREIDSCASSKCNGPNASGPTDPAIGCADIRTRIRLPLAR